MRFTIIACKVLYREISMAAALCEHTTDTVWLPQGLHNTPDLLREAVMREIENISLANEQSSALYHNKKPDAILLGYGLCSNGVVGIKAHDIPVIIPRTDDCIALFLGSQKRYKTYFDENPGVYWYNPGWIESTTMPSVERMELMRQEYIEKYGEDNADYLVGEEWNWIKNYSKCTYINSPVFDSKALKDFSKDSAKQFNWGFECLEGSMDMINKLLSGNWNQDEFLICPPNHTVIADYTGKKITCTQ